jgi:hypothetical protein
LVIDIVSVQNLYNVGDRQHEGCGTSAEAAGEKRIGAQEPRVQRRVEDLIGKGSVRRLPDGKDAGYAADGTLAARSFIIRRLLKVSPR